MVHQKDSNLYCCGHNTGSAVQAALKRLLAAACGGGSGGGGKGAGGGKDAAALSTARVAVRCLGSLLVALPHFNYANDLLQVLKLS